jgi:hypothetical protein
MSYSYNKTANWETCSDSHTTDDDLDSPKDYVDEELGEKEDLNTKVLNICSKDFNSLLFLAPPEIRAEQDSDLQEESTEPTLDSHITESILTSLGEEFNTKRKNNEKDTEKNVKQCKSCNIPDGGWVCLACKNYNFRGRIKCNRCGKKKTKYDPEGKPSYLSRKEGDEDFQVKQLRERVGDWLCVACHNINFCFRQQCNRCKREKSTIGLPLTEDYVLARSFQRQAKHFPMQCDSSEYPIVFQQLLMISSAA